MGRIDRRIRQGAVHRETSPGHASINPRPRRRGRTPHPNVAQTATVPQGRDRREGQALSLVELDALASAAQDLYGELVILLAHTGLRWGEQAGLQVGDRVALPAPGLRVQRAVLASSGSGELFVDSLESYRSCTIPLTPRAAEIVSRWASDKSTHDWLFSSPTGTARAERNRKPMAGWTAAKHAIGRPTLRVHDVRQTAASIWLASGADPKMVQRIVGHASATMTMDLYGHLIDTNLWETARRVRGHFVETSEEREGA